MNENFKSAVEKLDKFKLPRFHELPEIELYMDQVISTAEKYLSALKVGEKNLITPSMINNYVKNRVIEPPIKKRYTREHLAAIIIICTLKQTIEITEISAMIKMGKELFGIERTFDAFAKTYEEYIIRLANDARRADAEIDPAESEYNTIINDAILSSASRIVAEHALLSVMPEPKEEPPKQKKKKVKSESEEDAPHE